MKKTILILIIIIVIVLGLRFFLYQKFLSQKNQTQMNLSDIIHLSKPQPYDIISDTLIIEGEAKGNWFFEGTAPFVVLADDFSTVTSGFIEAKGDWMTENFVPFYKEVKLMPRSENGYLVLKNDNPSGLTEKDLYFMIPLKFKIPETMTVKVYFNNSQLDPEFSCNKVFPVERKILKTQTVAQAALEELLKGPTAEEKEKGFFTSINPNVKINSIKIKDNTAFVDFDEALEFQVGGSCRVSAIRAQITETLKQFPTIKNVIISINGRTEDILQP